MVLFCCQRNACRSGHVFSRFDASPRNSWPDHHSRSGRQGSACPVAAASRVACSDGRGAAALKQP